jgi:adenylate cyclase
MALFGAPIAHEDHAQRACYAALHLVEALRRHALDVRRQHGLDFALRMGLNSGEVVVGRIGDDLRMDYTAAGHCVGLAQRMESLAEAGSCYLTDATAALVTGYFELEDLGEFQVKGAGGPVRVHKLLGTGGARTRFDVSRSRGLTRFVGRGDDLQTLESALQRAREGHGSVLGVFAEAGTGKSRLCFEFLERARAEGLNVHEGRAVSHGKSIPLIPVLEILRDYFGIDERDEPRRAREKIAGRLLLLDDSFRDVLPVLFEFLGVGDPDSPPVRMDPEERQRQLFGVTSGLLRLSTSARPAILLIEDLHWLDGASEAWVRMWADAVAGTHNLLLVNSRPEYRLEWMQRSHYQQLALAPLGAEAIRELLEALLGSDPSTAGLGEAIHRRTRGNPFFAEEVVRSLIEAGQLVGTPGSYRLEGPVTELRVPDSVQALLAARIDRLPEREKQVLQTAAVIGKQFRGPVLERVSGLAGPELGDALARLRDGEFVYEESLYPVAEYAFKHPLTQEVALGSQLQERRKRTHAAVARAVEAFDADRLDEQAATLAHHWGEAGEPALAARWHARAARWATRTDTGEAHRHWERVRELTCDAQDDETRALLGAAYVELVNLGWRAGTFAAATREHFESGKRLFEATGDRRSLALLASNFTLVGGTHADIRNDANREAWRLAEEIGDIPLQIAVGVAIFPLLYSGRICEAQDRADRCIELIDRHGWTGPSPLHFDPYRWIHGARAWTRILLGDVAGALVDSDIGVERARSGDDYDLLLAHYLRAQLDTWRGAVEDGSIHAQRQFELSQKIGGFSNRFLGASAMGNVLALRGEWSAALPFFEESREAQLQVETYSPQGGLARALARCGQPERALEIARADAASAAGFGIALSELDLRIELAEVAALCGQAPEARAALARARELATQMECALRLPLISEVTAFVAGEAGASQERQSGLHEALRGYRALGADGHADRIARMLGESGPQS